MSYAKIAVALLLLIAGTVCTASAGTFNAWEHQKAFSFEGARSYNQYILVSLDPFVIEEYGGIVRITDIKVNYGYQDSRGNWVTYESKMIADVTLTPTSNEIKVSIPDKLRNYDKSGYSIFIDLYSKGHYFADP